MKFRTNIPTDYYQKLSASFWQEKYAVFAAKTTVLFIFCSGLIKLAMRLAERNGWGQLAAYDVLVPYHEWQLLSPARGDLELATVPA